MLSHIQGTCRSALTNIALQAGQAAAKRTGSLTRLSEDNTAPLAQPPAGPVEDDVSAAASAHATCAAGQFEPAAPTHASLPGVEAQSAAEVAASAVMSPQPTADTRTQSAKSYSVVQQQAALQDTLQLTELPGMLSCCFLKLQSVSKLACMVKYLCSINTLYHCSNHTKPNALPVLDISA